MRQLNAQYRKQDKPTDVLSFAQDQEVIIPGTPRLLGDVVISLDTAARQAAAAGQSLEDRSMPIGDSWNTTFIRIR